MTTTRGDGGAPDVLGYVRSALPHWFGRVDAAATVSFVGVDPIEVLRFRAAQGLVTYATVGMARHPMSANRVVGPDDVVAEQVVAAGHTTTAGGAVSAASTAARAELVLRTRGHHDGIHRQLAVLAAAPIVEGVVYRAGATVDLALPLAATSTCTGVLLDDSAVAPIPWPGGWVRLYELAPMTQTELQWCRKHGVAALRERWRVAGTDLFDLERDVVPLR